MSGDRDAGTLVLPQRLTERQAEILIGVGNDNWRHDTGLAAGAGGAALAGAIVGVLACGVLR